MFCQLRGFMTFLYPQTVGFLHKPSIICPFDDLNNIIIFFKKILQHNHHFDQKSALVKLQSNMPRTTSSKFISKSVTLTLTTCMFDGLTSLFQQSPYTYSSRFFSSPPNFSSPSKTNFILLSSFLYLQYLPTGHADARLLF